MNRRHLVSLALVLMLSACGSVGSGWLNPFNWFGASKEKQVATVDTSPTRDARPLVARIVALKVTRTPGGAIITAVGLPPTQGYWKAELVPVGGNEAAVSGALQYEFRVARPEFPQPRSTTPSREVVVGHFVRIQTLAGVRRIIVIAATNSRTVRRP